MGENKKRDPVENEKKKAAEAEEVKETAEAEETVGTETDEAEAAKAAEAEEETAETETGEETGEKEADKKDQKIAELEDKFKRLFAEFDNFRKRTDAEKSTRYADGEKAVLEKVLPLIDNFERALANVPAELEGNAYVEGMEKVYRSFMDAMSALGVTPIEAVGQPFNADFHNAVMHVEDEEAGEGIVVEEFQKGYMFKDRVLRYSMVKVAN